MIRGFQSFKEWFMGYEQCYTIIGGTACDLLMSDYDMDFRTTKDIDLVLILEALTPEFGQRFWEYILKGGYEHKNKGTGENQFYRFSKPESIDYPAMIELFSRKTDKVLLPENAVLTPIPMEEEVSSLSAILLDEAYYNFLKRGPVVLNGVSILNTPYLIPFKMKAWLDLTERKAKGEAVDGKNIRKHKNDVFRMLGLLGIETTVDTSGKVREDISEFLNKMKYEDIDLKQLGVRGSKADALDKLRRCYLL